MSNSNTTTVKAFNLIILLILIPLFSRAQEDLFIKGTVKSLGTGLPLQDCHVYVSNKNFGTRTKPDGSFELNLSKKCLTESLVVSHFGYKRYIIPVHNINLGILEVEMKRQIPVLGEIHIAHEKGTNLNYEISGELELENSVYKKSTEEILCLNEFHESMISESDDWYIYIRR